MARQKQTGMAIPRRILVCVFFVVFLHQNFADAASPEQCRQRAKRCTCKYPSMGENGTIHIDNQDTDTDHRSIGLAAATGTLGGLLATGSAVAAYFHFKGGADAMSSGGMGGGGGGGGGAGGGAGRGNYPRPESTGSSDSFGSESPLTKHDRSRGDKYNRPSSGGSVTSNNTNIYKQSRVWPGRF